MTEHPMLPIRTLHIVGQLEYGGITTWLRALVVGRNPAQLSVDIVCNYRKGVGVLAPQFESLGCRVFHVPLGWDIFKYQRRLAKFLRINTYDIVHDHRSFLGGATQRTAAHLGVPVRVMYHHTPNDDRSRGMARRIIETVLRSWAKKYATDIWAVSLPAMETHYGQKWNSDSRKRIVAGGVVLRAPGAGAREQIRSEFGISPSQKTILFAGRVTQPKNPIGAVTVALRLLEKNPHVHFVLAGDGPLMNDVRSLTQAHPCAARIHLPGFRNDIPDLLAAADIFLQPSYFEGLPLTTIEALYAGVPIVASTAPGITAVLPEQFREFCAAPDDIDALERSVLLILANPPPRVPPEQIETEFGARSGAERVTKAYQEALKRRQKHCLNQDSQD